jgi:glycolate oxidase FAD binding subunit
MSEPGQPVDLVLSLARIKRITDYPASDLTISVEAGLPVRELAGALAAEQQMLPLDVSFAAEATIGGVVATNSTGPQRLACGSWRDLVLGVHFVTAEGVLAKGGGKVVKNVAGYDLPKLLIGSMGTLAVMVEIAFKALPMPPASATFVLSFSSVEAALEAARRIRHSPLAPQALDLVDAAAGSLAGHAGLTAPFTLRVAAAGPEVVLGRFERELHGILRGLGGEVALLRGEAESALWSAVQELTPTFVRSHAEDGTVVKASLPLTQMGSFLAQAQSAAEQMGIGAASVARAGNGIVYCYLSDRAEAGDSGDELLLRTSELLIEAAEQLGGRAVVEWCPAAWKNKMNLWGTLRDDIAWMRRVKEAMDPGGVLNPGRFYGGI